MAIERAARSDRWGEDDNWNEDRAAAVVPLTREQAQALRASQPSVSPWRVTATQAAVGAAVTLAAWLLGGSASVAASAAYGAAVVVVPGALMARGMTSRIGSLSPATGAVGFMLWEAVKIAVSIAMLMLAPTIVQPLSWPALLVALVICIKVYWVALLWRRPSKS